MYMFYINKNKNININEPPRVPSTWINAIVIQMQGTPTDKQILVWVIYLFSHAFSIYTVYVFNFENVVISHV
jgi:hypothetical protein